MQSCERRSARTPETGQEGAKRTAPRRRIELAPGIVAAPNPLLPGSSIFQVELLRGRTTIATGDIYSVSIDGSYSNGQEFSYAVTIVPVIGQ